LNLSEEQKSQLLEKEKIDKSEVNGMNMSEEQVKNWLGKENIDQAISVLKEVCNGHDLHQYWHILKTNSQFFNHILLDSLNKQQGKAPDSNEANMKKIKHFADALDRLFVKGI
jgi:predicted alpha/beta-fold hydrolase